MAQAQEVDDSLAVSQSPINLFTLPEATALLQMTRIRLHSLVLQRRVTHYRIGGSIRFSEEQIQSFLDDCLDGPDLRNLHLVKNPLRVSKMPQPTRIPKPDYRPSAGTTLFTLPEAAAQMRISRTKLYQLVRQRKIVHYRIGGSIRFSTKQIEDYLESCIDGPINPFAGMKREFL